MLSKSFEIIAAGLALASCSMAAPAKGSTELSTSTRLRIADSAADRYEILSEDKDWVYEFNDKNPPIATSKSFPALVGQGVSMTIATVPPCDFANLHIHPRAAEVFGVISGKIVSEAVPESGVLDKNGKPRIINNVLGPNTITVYPAGVFHAPMNKECKEAVISVAFSSEDPGTTLIIPRTFDLSDDLLAANFGDSLTSKEIARLRAAIPKDAIIQLKECRARCKLGN